MPKALSQRQRNKETEKQRDRETVRINWKCGHLCLLTNEILFSS